MSNNPEDILKDPDQIKQLIGILSSLLPKEEEEPKTKTRKKRVAKKKTTKKTTSRKNAASITKKNANAKVNKFVDMPESQMFKEDPKVAKKLYQQPPMKRRSLKRKISVTCRICGKREEISSGLLHGDVDRYKCNKCCSNAG